MNPNTLQLITNELADLNRLRLFHYTITKLLFDDLKLANLKGVAFNDRDIFECIEGLKNLSTGWDEEDPDDGEFIRRNPSYNQLKEKATKLSKGLVGGGIIPLKKENDELRLKVDALEKTIVEQKEDIQQYKDTLDEHLHHYDLLKKKNEKLEHDNYTLRQDAKGYGEEEVNEYREEIEELKEEINSLQLQNESLLTNKTEGQKIAQQKASKKRKKNAIERREEIKKLKSNQRHHTLDDFMERSESWPEYKDFVKEYYPDVSLKEVGLAGYESEEEEDEEEKVKKKFLERHNITEEEMVEMMKKSCGISPEEEVNCHKCKELGTDDKPVGGATDENDISICDDCYDEWDCQ